MKMSLYTFTLALCIFCSTSMSFVRAQTIISDPIQDYLNPASLDMNIAMKQSKELLKLTLDINGDGKPVVFLALPCFYVKHGGFSWTAYVPTAGGYIKAAFAKEGPTLTFYPNRVFLGAIPELGGRHALITAYAGHGSGEIHAFWIKNYIISEQIINVYTYEEEGLSSGSSQPAIFQQYFPDAGNPNAQDPYPVQHITFDALRAQGYSIPANN